jgi:carboxylesterase
MQKIIFPERLRELAQPYFYKAEKNPTNTLIILVHGFGASATETRPLGEFLCLNGYDISGVLLSGHGTNSRDLDSINWKDWYTDIKQAYQERGANYEHVFIGGVSMGGAVALYSSSKLKFDGVFTINALYKLKGTWKFFAWMSHFFKSHRPRSPKRIKWYIDHDLFAYQEDSTFAAYQMLKFLRALHKQIKKITIPALILQSKEDRTLNPQNAEWIYENLQTEKELMMLEKGDHILTVDENREVAFEKILSFLKDKISK